MECEGKLYGIGYDIVWLDGLRYLGFWAWPETVLAQSVGMVFFHCAYYSTCLILRAMIPQRDPTQSFLVLEAIAFESGELVQLTWVLWFHVSSA